MSLLVREAGLQSLLVDFGRERSRSLGVPVGGAADRAALSLGNALVGNSPQAVTLEVAFAGPILEALHATACVVFGAPFQSTVNGNSLAPGVTFTLEVGDVLRIGGTRLGARAYLCVAGGFEASEVLGSRSSLEPLRAGDTLRCPPSRIEARGLPFERVRGLVATEEPNPPSPFPGKEGGARGLVFGPSPLPGPREALLTRPGTGPGGAASGASGEGSSMSSSPLPAGRGAGGVGSLSLRVLDGPQLDWFTDDAAFFAHHYEVSGASNRMGLRLKGSPLARRSGELVSEPVAPGAVQVTNDGLPVILGVDGQTIGGYPKVAHVIRADLDLLAQLRPGDRVRFVRVSHEEAEAAARERADFLRAWLTRLQIAERQPVIG